MTTVRGHIERPSVPKPSPISGPIYSPPPGQSTSGAQAISRFPAPGAEPKELTAVWELQSPVTSHQSPG